MRVRVVDLYELDVIINLTFPCTCLAALHQISAVVGDVLDMGVVLSSTRRVLRVDDLLDADTIGNGFIVLVGADIYKAGMLPPLNPGFSFQMGRFSQADEDVLRPIMGIWPFAGDSVTSEDVFDSVEEEDDEDDEDDENYRHLRAALANDDRLGSSSGNRDSEDEDAMEQQGNINVDGVRIELGPEDRDAVARLVGLGFDYGTVIQVYEACDRNERTTQGCLLTMQ